MFSFSTEDILRGSDPAGNPFSVAHGCSSSPPPVAIHAGRPDPPPDRIRRRRPRLSSLLPRPPTSAVCPPSLPPTVGRSFRPLVGTRTVFLYTEGSLCTSYFLLDVSGFYFFVCSSSIKYTSHGIVGKVGRMLFFCTEAVTHNFQIAFERPQYRVKWHVLDHIRPASTLQNFQYSIETIFAF